MDFTAENLAQSTNEIDYYGARDSTVSRAVRSRSSSISFPPLYIMTEERKVYVGNLEEGIVLGLGSVGYHCIVIVVVIFSILCGYW